MAISYAEGCCYWMVLLVQSLNISSSSSCPVGVQAGGTGTTDGDDGTGTHVDRAARSEEAS